MIEITSFLLIFLDLVKSISTAIAKLDGIEIKVRDMESNIEVLKKNGSNVSDRLNSLETIENKLAYVENNTSTFEPK